MINLKLKLKKSSFFSNVFFLVFSVSFILITVVTSYAYTQSKKFIIENYLANSKSTVIQAKNNLEQKMRVVEYSLNAYSTTSTFKDLTEKNLTYKDYNIVKKLGSDLTYIGAMGIENIDINLISIKNHWKINGSSLNNLTDKEIVQLNQNIKNQKNDFSWQSFNGGLRLQAKLPAYQNNYSAIALVDIPKQNIENDFSKFKNSIYISYGNSQLLFGNKSELPKDIISNEYTKSEIKKVGSNFFVIEKSDYNNMLIILKVSNKEIKKAVAPIKVIVSLLFTLIIILLVLASYLIAKFTSRPLNQINEKLAITDGYENHTEFEGIITNIENIIKKNKFLTLQEKLQRPDLEQLFILNLFRNNINKHDLISKADQFNYPISKKNFVVMLIQIDDFGDKNEADTDILLYSIKKIIEEVVNSNCRFLPIVLNANIQANILYFDETEDWHKKTSEICQLIQKPIKEYLKIQISIGISSSYNQLSHSKTALDEAKEALHFRLNLNSEVIVFYNEIANRFSNSVIVKYPSNLERVYLDALRGNDREYLIQSYEEVFRKILTTSQTPLSIETSILKLTNNTIQLGQLLGVDQDIFLNNKDIYSKIISVNNTSKIKKIILNQLVLPIWERQ